MMKYILIPILLICCQLVAQNEKKGTITLAKQYNNVKIYPAYINSSGNLQMIDIYFNHEYLLISTPTKATMLYAYALEGTNQIPLEIVSFDIIFATHNELQNNFSNTGNKFNKAILEQFSQLQADAVVYFENIQMKNKNICMSNISILVIN